MKLPTFELERNQSLWENEVDFNLTESGLHPYGLADVLSADELNVLATLPLGYGHTDGDPALKDGIASLYRGKSAANVLVTNGSAEANFVAMWSLLEPGDEIVYMVPNYMQIHGLAQALGAKVVPWQLRESLAWAPDLDELRQLLTNRTRMIVLCNPNNPTGAVLAPDVMRRITAIAERHGCMVHSDEIYRGSELDGVECPSFADLYPDSVVVSGLSKALGFPGLRIGWIVAPERIVEECWRRHDYTSISTGIVSQFAATRILAPEARARLLARGRKHLNHNLAIVQRWMQRFGNRLRLIAPQAGGMAWVGYSAPIGSQQLVDQLREQHGVFLVAGAWFGMEGFIRIGIGVESDRLEAGLARIEPTLDALFG